MNKITKFFSTFLMASVAATGLLLATAPQAFAVTDTAATKPTGSANVTGVTSVLNAYDASATSYATWNTGSDVADFTNFNISIPSGATINTVAANLTGYRDSAITARQLLVSVAANGSTFSTTQTTSFGTSASTQNFTGATTLWGQTWTPDNFNNNNFRVRIGAITASSSKYAYLVNLTVAVSYTLTLPATTLVTNAITDTYGNTVTLTGTLAAGGTGLSGKTVSFTLNSGAACSNTTDASGVATCTATLKTKATTYATGVGASFAGDSSYAASSGTASLTVNKHPITVTAATNTKVYDGTTSAAAVGTLTSGTIVSGDTAPTWTETYDNKNVGTGKTLTPAGAVSDGNSGNNYAVTFVADTTGVISAKAITVTAATNSKAYDGTTTATAAPTISPALVAGDTTGFSETYDTAAIGTGKTLAPAGTVSDGNGGANYAVTFANNITGVITKINTTTTVTDTPDPTNVGVAYTVTANVARSGSVGQPSGTVTVTDGTDSCTIASITGTTGTSTGSCSLTSTTGGSKTLTASYSGDSTFNTSSKTTAHTVNTAPDLVVTKTNNVSDNASVGSPFNWVLTITNSGNASATFTGGILSGTTILSDSLPSSGASYGTPVDVEGAGTSGTVNCSISSNNLTCATGIFLQQVIIPVGGTITVTVPVTPTVAGSLVNPRSGGSCAVDSGGNVTESNDGNNSCSNTVTVGGGKINTTTAITFDDPDPSAVNTAYTVAVSVTASSGTVTPTGTVTVTDGSASCTTPDITGTGNAATGSCSLTSTTTGSKTLTATYSGDTNFNGGSGTTTHTVSDVALTTTHTIITPDTIHTDYGSSFTLTATVTPDSGTDQPTGYVNFYADGVSDANLLNKSSHPTLSGGITYYTTTEKQLLAGSHQITAIYVPSGNFVASTAPAVTQNVSARPLTVSNIVPSNKSYDGTEAVISFTTAGAALVSTTLGDTGILSGDTVTFSLSGLGGVFNNKNVGTGKAVTITGITIDGASVANYSIVQPTGLIADITPASLGVTPKAVSKTYDGSTLNNTTYSDVVLNYTITGLQNSETEATAGIAFTGSMAFNGLTTTEVKNANTYTQGVGLLAMTSTNNNYSMTFTNTTPNNYVITKADQAAVTVSGVPASATYGQTGITALGEGGSSSSAFSYSATGSCTVDPSTGVVAITSGSGTCTITATKPSDTNYNEATGTATITTINATAITVTADPQTKAYGTVTDPALTYKITAGALASGDTLTGNLVRDPGETVGTYAIKQGTLANANYSITYVGDNLTITPASQTIIFTSTVPATPVVGDTYTPTATGGATGNPVTFTIDLTTVANCSIDVSNKVTFLAAANCVIDANQAGDDNYSAATQVQQSITVSEKPAPVITLEKSAGATDTTVTITWTTDHAATSRVVYGQTSVPTPGSAPKYGYTDTTVEDPTLTTSHSVTVTGLTSGTTYYFRAVSHGSPEAVSGEITQATTTPTPVTPSTPLFVAPTPANGSTVTPAQMPEIDWSSSTGGTGTITYHYEVYSDAGYVTRIYNADQAATKIVTAGTGEGTYYIRVQATDANNVASAWSNGAGSNAYVITIKNSAPVPGNPPTAPAFVTPTPISGSTVTSLAEVDWSTSTGGTGAITYQYEVYSDSGYTNRIYNADQSATSISTAGTGNGIYYIRVRAVDSTTAASNWSNDGSKPYEIIVDSNYVAPAGLTVTIAKYIVGGGHATAANTDSASFPMISDSLIGGGTYALSAAGYNGGQPYEATTSLLPAGSNYNTSETLTTTCANGGAYELAGYSTSAISLDDAAQKSMITGTPSFTNLQANQYVVVWNTKCAPSSKVTVTIAKYIVGGGHATVANTDSASFPMISDSSIGGGTYALSAAGYNGGNPYEATTSLLPAGSSYNTSETLTTTCANGGAYELAGYSTSAISLDDAAQKSMITGTPSFTNLQANQYVVVWNKKCGSMTPVNGACGSANGKSFSSAPTSDLCSAGDASPVTGSGPWSWTCIGQNTGTTANCSAQLAVTPTGTIKITKTTTGADTSASTFTFNINAGTDTVGSRSISISGNDTASMDPVTANVGSYIVQEVLPSSNWTLVSVTCDNVPMTVTQVSVIVTEGHETDCTFTNTYNDKTKGTLIVTKNTTGGDGIFNFTGSGIAGFPITTKNGTGSYTINNLTPGKYTVSETTATGWRQTGNNCRNARVVAGQISTCAITNAAVKLNQTIKATQPASAPKNAPFNVSATASSGLPVTVSVSGGNCSVSGTNVSSSGSNVVIMMGSGNGICVVRYNQGGNASYNAAPQVAQNTTMAKANQTITYIQPASAARNARFTVSATATSGLTVMVSTSGNCGGGGISVGGHSVGLTMGNNRTASCTVNYSQFGNAAYNSATATGITTVK